MFCLDCITLVGQKPGDSLHDDGRGDGDGNDDRSGDDDRSRDHCGYRSHKHSGGREEGGGTLFIRSTLPPLISDTLVTGLVAMAMATAMICMRIA